MAPRYFERRLLHTIAKTSEDLLARLPGFVACSCGFCSRLRNSPSWDTGLSGGHYLMQVGAATSELATPGGGGRRKIARKRVRLAQKYLIDALKSVPLSGADPPNHLPLWSQRLL